MVLQQQDTMATASRLERDKSWQKGGSYSGKTSEESKDDKDAFTTTYYSLEV